MDFDVEHELIARFYPQFGFKGEPSDNATWGINCGNGWSAMIRSMCIALEYREKLTGQRVAFTSIKQKMGILQCTFAGSDEFTRGLAELAHWMSYVTCEICGNKGNIARGNQGWVRVLCPSCRTANPG
ncbi:hypothetical protein JRG49_06155 [Pseudomonas fulva]|jgi:hypothetical protein|uniref:hypothetical protein n=1 Tax=Pseudomonas TaxID=286 RepID=UPI0011203BD4|nr:MULTISPECIES: hypothetical protein [Pseudomonas]MBN6789824.1 hypothetical protein [Pseudomonas fulva]MBN6794794.1 hypothetical protein [Pseudomonas fulva]MBN6855387.1 hypothetical protein [Pseudomonas fulva]MBN6872416.1 hypothetical protein [Pseudomonas fulva]MBN6876806.1 hypothetical protein [Pseudomonas fulva]